MHVCEAAAGAKLGKIAHCLNQQQQGLLLEISYIPLLSVMTIHYNRLYQISGLEGNLSLEDMKQLCRQKPTSQVHPPPKTNN